MKRNIALLPLLLLSTLLSVNISFAQEAPAGPIVHRLDYVHFDALTQTAEWAVSEGTMNDAGTFVPSGDTPSTYSMKVGSGGVLHDGEVSRLSRNDSMLSSQVFAALSQMMRVYTDAWGAEDDPDVQNSQGDDAENDNPVTLYYIASHCRTVAGASSETPVRGHIPAAKIFQIQGRACAGGPAFHGLQRTSAVVGKNDSILLAGALKTLPPNHLMASGLESAKREKQTDPFTSQIFSTSEPAPPMQRN